MKSLQECTTVAEIREYAMRQLESEEAMLNTSVRPRRGTQRGGSSIVFSFRLAREEAAALERRAEALGVGPTVLARNLVRNGLGRPMDLRLRKATEELATLLEELSTLAV